MPHVASLHGPSLSLKAQWPDRQWGCAPLNRPLSLWPGVVSTALLASDFEQFSSAIGSCASLGPTSGHIRPTTSQHEPKMRTKSSPGEVPRAQHEAKHGSETAPWTPLEAPYGESCLVVDFLCKLRGFLVSGFIIPRKLRGFIRRPSGFL